MKEKTTKRDIMLVYIQQKVEASLADLRKKFKEDRRAIHYNLPILYEEGKIRCFIKGNGLKDDDIIYTVVDKRTLPQYITKLIKEMCGDDYSLSELKKNEFIELCVFQGVHKDVARILAHALMAGVPGLKEKVPYELTYNEVLESDYKKQDQELKEDIRDNIKFFVGMKIHDLLRDAGLVLKDSDEFPSYTAKDFDDGER